MVFPGQMHQLSVQRAAAVTLLTTLLKNPLGTSGTFPSVFGSNEGV